jgi:uncharacterized membrane protein YfhO
VDGKNVPLLRANYLFQAVWLTPGNHRVRLFYRPVVFYIGACLSLLGMLGILVKKYWRKFVR